MIKCSICESNSKSIFTQTVLNKYAAEYFQCTNCGFVQPGDAHWLEEAYATSINISDTGILQRNLYFSRVTSVLIFFLLDRRKKFLDFAGGYGIFTRLMRDRGFDFYWSDKYTENLLARGFEVVKLDADYELLTSFESLEHFVEPLKEVREMLDLADNLLLSTEIFKGAAPDPNQWDYYGFTHGQHISLFSLTSLETLAIKLGLNFYTNGRSLHFFSKRKYSRLKVWFLFKSIRLGSDRIVAKFAGSLTISDWKALS